MTVQFIPEDTHDQHLLSHVHPRDWKQPTPTKKYHLVVLGGGTAGLVCAAGAAGLGARVALIERDLLGGDCLNVGCVPSKALLAAAHAAAAARNAGTLGVKVPTVEVDFPAIMQRMRRLRAELAPHDSASRFQSLGVDVFLGEGKFRTPQTIEVNDQTLSFHRAVIATGSRAARPDIPGLEEAGYLTNSSIFALTRLPPRLMVLGGGPIGCELAQAFARFGSHVTLISQSAHLLPREDADLSARVEASLVRDGITVLQNAKTLAAQRHGSPSDPESHVTLRVQQNGNTREIHADAILVAVGRQPGVEGMGFENANVTFDLRSGVQVDDHLRTTNPRIFAAGDVCSRYQFTHAADAMARIVIQNALFWGRSRASSLTIPWCTYTSPELARVGLSEQEAREKNIPVQIITQELNRVDRAVLEGETEGVFKVLLKPGTDRVLGISIVASRAGDMIGEASLAMTSGLRLGALAKTIHPYPTQAEAFRKLGDAYNRTRLTPFVRRLLGLWLRLWA